jgi:hypothetical protein
MRREGGLDMTCDCGERSGAKTIGACPLAMAPKEGVVLEQRCLEKAGVTDVTVEDWGTGDFLMIYLANGLAVGVDTLKLGNHELGIEVYDPSVPNSEWAAEPLVSVGVDRHEAPIMFWGGRLVTVKPRLDTDSIGGEAIKGLSDLERRVLLVLVNEYGQGVNKTPGDLRDLTVAYIHQSLLHAELNGANVGGMATRLGITLHS